MVLLVVYSWLGMLKPLKHQNIHMKKHANPSILNYSKYACLMYITFLAILSTILIIAIRPT